jgi:hypothetical protein
MKNMKKVLALMKDESEKKNLTKLFLRGVLKAESLANLPNDANLILTIKELLKEFSGP